MTVVFTTRFFEVLNGEIARTKICGSEINFDGKIFKQLELQSLHVTEQETFLRNLNPIILKEKNYEKKQTLINSQALINFHQETVEKN